MDIYADEFDVWKMRLSKSGYGSIDIIKNLDVKTFVDLVHYETYQDKYLKAFRALNEKK